MRWIAVMVVVGLLLLGLVQILNSDGSERVRRSPDDQDDSPSSQAEAGLGEESAAKSVSGVADGVPAAADTESVKTRKLRLVWRPLGGLAPLGQLKFEWTVLPSVSAGIGSAEFDWRESSPIEVPADARRLRMRIATQGWALFPANPNEVIGNSEWLAFDLQREEAEPELRLFFGIPFVVAGRVHDIQTAEPAAGRTIHLQSPGGIGGWSVADPLTRAGNSGALVVEAPGQSSGIDHLEAHCDPEGRFRFPPIPPGLCSLTMMGNPGFAERGHVPVSPFAGFMGLPERPLRRRGIEFFPEQRSFRLELIPGRDFSDLDLSICKPVMLRGLVLDAQGEALPHVVVVAGRRHLEVGDEALTGVEARTDAEGRFCFEEFQQGQWGFRVRRGAMLSQLLAKLEVEPGETPPEQTLRLPADGELRITVRNEAGEPIANQDFEVYRIRKGFQYENGVLMMTGTSDLAGVLEMKGIGAGRVSVRSRRADPRLKMPVHLIIPEINPWQNVVVAAHERVDVDFVVRRAFIYRGQVVSSDLVDCDGCRLEFEPSKGGYLPDAKLSADGSFVLASLNEGPIYPKSLRLKAREIEFKAARRQPIWADADEITISISED